MLRGKTDTAKARRKAEQNIGARIDAGTKRRQQNEEKYWPDDALALRERCLNVGTET